MKVKTSDRGVYMDIELKGPIFSAEIQTTSIRYVIGYYRLIEQAKKAYRIAIEEIIYESEHTSRSKLISRAVYLRKGYGWQSILKYRKRKYSCGTYFTSERAEHAACQAMDMVRTYEEEWDEITPEDVLRSGIAKIRAENKED